MDFEARLLGELSRTGKLSDVLLSERLDTSVRTVQRRIQQLKKSGKICVRLTKFQIGGNWVNQREIEVRT